MNAEVEKPPFVQDKVYALLRDEWVGPAPLNATLRELQTPPATTTLRVVPSLAPPLEEIFAFLREWTQHKFAIEVHPVIADVISLTQKAPDGLADTDADSVPASSGRHPVVLVDPHCGHAVLRGSHVYAKGVLASEPGLKVGSRVSVYAYVGPKQGDRKLLRGTYLHTTDGQQDANCADTLADADSGAADTADGAAVSEDFDSPAFRAFCGDGVLEMSPLSIYQSSCGLAIRMDDAIDFQTLPPYLFPQNLPSAVVAHVMGCQPGESVADLCAAPGGKTTHICSLMDNQGWVLAIDRSQKRVDELKGTVLRHQATIAECICADATTDKWTCSRGSCQDLQGKFDRVLIDAPCSATGLRPRLTFGEGDLHIDSLSQIQRRLIQRPRWACCAKTRRLIRVSEDCCR
ncbi:unnamed protein product [Vitrella brassicaformis CCMP3155]|uniref:SAM-dependent MTase RsmB/NOP-type domain-containing protein n=1 Tax=Vitrella brassicaformis (strain CCMP3155) TaxID=1169540 RepID=A0A0G4EYE1_VITBC|nr:unnamed protein product [Vitrella brassicaformis CCMP3155]|eukprot:CEM03680.1 unnamed protein product [Vitrella brassicaformis CCMP3155]